MKSRLTGLRQAEDQNPFAAATTSQRNPDRPCRTCRTSLVESSFGQPCSAGQRMWRTCRDFADPTNDHASFQPLPSSSYMFQAEQSLFRTGQECQQRLRLIQLLYLTWASRMTEKPQNQDSCGLDVLASVYLPALFSLPLCPWRHLCSGVGYSLARSLSARDEAPGS